MRSFLKYRISAINSYNEFCYCMIPVQMDFVIRRQEWQEIANVYNKTQNLDLYLDSLSLK